MASPQVLYSRSKKVQVSENKVISQSGKNNSPADSRSSRSNDSPSLISVGGIIRKDISPQEIAQGEIDANKETARLKLENLLERTDTILLTIKTVFPFVLFPTTMVIDLNKVDVVNQSFFFSERRHSVEIKDIMDVYLDTSLFFASLKIVIKDAGRKIIIISYLKKKEAIKARKIIQGLITAHRENIDLIVIKDDNLLSKIEALGSINQG